MSDEAAPARSFRRRGLGRGLEALLSSEPDPADGPPLVNLDPRTVAPNPEQPRRSFDPEALQALGDSIRLHGLLHPIVVQRDGDAYQLVAGERRSARRPARRRLGHPGDRPPSRRVRPPLPRDGAHREPGPDRSQSHGGSRRLRAPLGCLRAHPRGDRAPPRSQPFGCLQRDPAAQPSRSRAGGGRGLAADSGPRAGAAGTAGGNRSGSSRRRGDRRRAGAFARPSMRSRSASIAPRWRRPIPEAPRRRRLLPPPTTSRCGAASSRPWASRSASSAAKAAGAGSSSTGPRTRTWTPSIERLGGPAALTPRWRRDGLMTARGDRPRCGAVRPRGGAVQPGACGAARGRPVTLASG